MNPLLYKIPEAFVAAHHSGELALVGAVLKEAVSGRIVGHVQQTAATGSMISTLAGQFGPTLLSGNPLGAAVNILGMGVSVWQNHGLSNQMTALQASMDIMQNMQIAGMMLSGVGLGISVVGFAAMNSKLRQIGSAIEELDSKIDLVTSHRRADTLSDIVTRIGTDIETVDGLHLRRDRKGPAERSSESLRQQGDLLVSRLSSEIRRADGANATMPDTARILSLSAMIRLAHEASTRALLMIDETDEAGRLASLLSARLLATTAPLSPDALARISAAAAPSPTEALALRKAALASSHALVGEMRQSVQLIASQGDLAATLTLRGIRGPEYLEAVEEASSEPLLILAA